MDDQTKVSAQPVPAPVSSDKDVGFVPTTPTPPPIASKTSTEDSIEKILDELEQEYKKKPAVAETTKSVASTNASPVPPIAPLPTRSNMAMGATIPDTTIPTPKKFILPPVQNAPKKGGSGGGIIQKLGGTKFVVGAIGLFLAIGGLTSVVMLSQQSTYNLPKAGGPCSSPGEYEPICSSECTKWKCGDDHQWYNTGESCSGGNCTSTTGGTNDGGNQSGDGTNDGNDNGGNNCNDCGGANQGFCQPNQCGTGSGGCDAGLAPCGGGCYPSGWRTCSGMAGCRDPQYACPGDGDQCAGINCPTGQHCNGGFCVLNESENDPDNPVYTYEKYICPQGCGSDGQCEGDDPGVIHGGADSDTVLGPNDCGQIDVYGANHTYIQVKQNTCGSSVCGTSTPPPSNPPSSPNPTPSPGSPACIGLTSSIAIPTLGSAPVFTCAIAQTANKYEFRWKLGAGAFAMLDSATANSNISEPLAVNASGTYTVQCRPCNGSACANWESL